MIWELICWIFLLFFTLLGIAVTIYFFLFHLLAPSGKREYLLLIPSAASQNAVGQIYAAQLRAELLGRRQCGGVLVICDGLDPETARECEAACRACDRAQMCTAAGLSRQLQHHEEGNEEPHAF